MSNSEICFKTAAELARLIGDRKLAPSEVMEAHLKQIESINPKINAIVTLTANEAIQHAKEADEALVRGDATGPLHGIPVAHKDLFLTKGVRTTFGSPILSHFVPDRDDIIVERLKKAGAISVGKTNVPEFGAGSQTFNEVFGPTLNPYDMRKTCGGSSGGAAVALACRLVPIADGSDLGGSLRNPANFCNVVGFRSSPGRVPSASILGWFSLPVVGPMARTVEDTALMLSAIAGPDSRSPIAINEPGSVFAQTLERRFRGTRIAWSRNLGELPVDTRITTTIEAQRIIFEKMGCLVEDRDPDFSGADEIFKVLRAWYFNAMLGDLLKSQRDKIKDTVIWNIEEGARLSGARIAEVELQRTKLYHRIREFMENYDFLILPVNQVPPFDIDQPYVTEINGERMETYIDWMRSCYYITTIGLPAISVPCGFTTEGLPVGVQIVGRHRDDLGVLQLAYAFERETAFWKQKPSIVE
jgi:amidase